MMSTDSNSPNSVKLYDLRACRNCAQSKTKCLSTNLSSTSCDRCYRLKKQCVPQTPHARKPRAAAGRKNRIAELEKRMDLISRTVQRDRASEDSEPEASGSSPVAVIGHEDTARNATPATAAKVQDAPAPSQRSTGSSSTHNLIPSLDQDVQALIEVYRTQCARFFPFVSVPDCSVGVWREKHPSLLVAVCLVASYKDRIKQTQLGHAVMEDACTRSMLRGERNLDLLQGLLVYLSWYHCHFAVQSQGQSQVSSLLSMCVALVADLGLNRPSHRNDRRHLIGGDKSKSFAFAETNERWTPDEKLALLGCFYASVVVCVCFKRLDAVPYTSHIDEIRKSLLTEGDSLHSTYIDYLVRIQALTYKIDKSLPYNNPTAVWQFIAPVSMHVESLRAELISFRNSVPMALKTEPLLELNICTAEIYLHEVSLYDLQWRDFSTTQSSQRLDMLYACLQSTKNYFDAFISITDHDFRTISWCVFSQLAFALIVSSRLSVLELPGWNLDEVRRELDFGVAVGLIIARLESMNALAKAEWTNGQDDPMWSRMAQSFARIKTWFDAQKAESQDQPQPPQQQEVAQLDMGVFIDPTLGLMDDLEMGGGLMSDWFQGWPELNN